MISRKFPIKILALSVIFLFLFMEFYNFSDQYILFIFQKIGIGILSFGFFVGYLLRFRPLPKYSYFLIFFFLFLSVISTITSSIHFGQPAFYGFIGQFKLLGVFYFFLALWALKFFRANLHDIEGMLICLAIISLVSFSLVHFFVDPKELYTKGGNLILKDSKGYRFKFQDIFIVIYLFYNLRKFIYRKNKLFSGLLIVLIILYLIFFQQERAELLSILIVLCWRLLTKSSSAIKAAYIFLTAAILIWVLWQPNLYSDVISNIDFSSLNAREHTFEICYHFISSSFYNLMSGAGNLNSIWKNGFTRMYGTNFFLADIGWVGITFEFGLIGALLCLYLYIKVIRETEKTATVYQSPMLYAIADYLTVRLILSIFSPHIPYFVGIYTSILAIDLYLLKNYEENAPLNV